MGLKDRTQFFCMLAIFPISFFNAKWTQTSLESLIIKLYLHIKIYLDYFRGRLKNADVEFQCQTLVRLHHNTHMLLFCIDLSTKSYQGLWFNGTHLPLFQKISVKIYSNFFFSSGDPHFKTNYSKDKMRHGMWVHILLNNLASSS